MRKEILGHESKTETECRERMFDERWAVTVTGNGSTRKRRSKVRPRSRTEQSEKPN